MLQRVAPCDGDARRAFNPLTRHFLVKGFCSDGIDQMMAHFQCVEAALAKERDTKAEVQKRIDKLTDTQHGEDFHALYQRRNDFMHGREFVKGLSVNDLARLQGLVADVIRAFMHRIIAEDTCNRDELLSRLASSEGNSARTSSRPRPRSTS